jgi:hypothetical protein
MSRGKPEQAEQIIPKLREVEVKLRGSGRGRDGGLSHHRRRTGDRKKKKEDDIDPSLASTKNRFQPRDRMVRFSPMRKAAREL